MEYSPQIQHTVKACTCYFRIIALFGGRKSAFGDAISETTLLLLCKYQTTLTTLVSNLSVHVQWRSMHTCPTLIHVQSCMLNQNATLSVYSLSVDP